ncbi:hypothetical protein [Aeromicrobium sp.]|uniref:hypothetical protein n=1 Tax=Aeromicrobium sp. TaxID=1871063 RepID=UPI002FCB8ACA
MLTTSSELAAMLEMTATRGIELCLFVGSPRWMGNGSPTMNFNGRALASTLHGSEELAWSLEDIVWACELGLRSILAADIGLIYAIKQLKTSGDLPEDLVVKVSASLLVTNPATAVVFEDLGATTLDLPVDLPIQTLSAIRSSTTLPLDLYIDGPGDLASPVRYYELPEVVRVGSPVYLNFTVRNAPSLPRSGGHNIQSLVEALAKARVRHISSGVRVLNQYLPGARVSAVARPSS